MELGDWAMSACIAYARRACVHALCGYLVARVCMYVCTPLCVGYTVRVCMEDAVACDCSLVRYIDCISGTNQVDRWSFQM
jgi:hypothetical protein